MTSGADLDMAAKRKIPAFAINQTPAFRHIISLLSD
jgi:hypothetical protein